MLAADGLRHYLTSQLLDLLLILAMMVAGVVVGTLLWRLSSRSRGARRLATAGATLIVIGAGFDLIEDLISFAMIADPIDFPDWIVLPYSTAASLKFVSLGAGLACLLGSAIASGLAAVRLIK